jgi:hypothetical protein
LRNRQIGFQLMTIGHFLGIRAGVTHFVGISNPRTITLFVDKLGWQIVGEQLFDASHNVPYLPILGLASEVRVFQDFPSSEVLFLQDRARPKRVGAARRVREWNDSAVCGTRSTVCQSGR